MAVQPETNGDTTTTDLDFSPRRSGRSRKTTERFDPANIIPTPLHAGNEEPPQRRNPKRKASESTKPAVALPDELLDAALAPLTLEEVEEWEGWVELESEPAFFSTILREWGVKNVKAQELFGVDEMSLDMLPKPVFGLIFLFQVIPGLDEDEVEEVETGNLWFANQTIANACATIALLNIIMNAEDVDLGKDLRAFKQQTRDLSTPLRGHYIGANKFIRSVHNSFTRRMDHLNADLYIENDVSDSMSRSKKRNVSRKNRRKGKKALDEFGFHFVAYVPHGGSVWELDGLKSRPRMIGPVESGEWTTVAQPHIQARMLQHAETQVAFNLLSICRSPLASLARAVASKVSLIRHLDQQMLSQPDYTNLISADPVPLDVDDPTQLAEFNLTKKTIEEVHISIGLAEKIKEISGSVDHAYKLRCELGQQLKSAMGEHRMETMSLAADEQRVQGRKKDYAPALHHWVKKLAEKGVLEDVIKSIS